MIRLTLLTVLIAGLVGCAQKAPETAQQTEAPGTPGAVSDPSPSTTPPAAETQIAPDAQLASVTLDGTMGCGHCTFHTTPDCAIAMKTGDGRIVVIDAAKLANEDHLFAERMSGKAVSVQGSVEEVGGQLVIHSQDVTFR